MILFSVALVLILMAGLTQQNYEEEIKLHETAAVGMQKSVSELSEKNMKLGEENKKLTAANALKEAHIQRLSADSEAAKVKALEAEKNAQKASQELLDARKQFEDEKHLLEQQIAGMKKASLWQRIKGWKE